MSVSCCSRNRAPAPSVWRTVLNVRRPSIHLAMLAFMLAADVPLMAQYPGQYPPGGYPPGGYPPGGGYPGGQYPQGGGSGIPWPKRKKKTESGKDTAADEANLKQIKGMLRQLDEKSIVVTADDSRNIQFKRAGTTKFLNKGEPMKADLLRPGDHIMVEANQYDEGYF